MQKKVLRPIESILLKLVNEFYIQRFNKNINMIEAINKRLNEYLGFDNKELYIDP
jgi:hypothetical protein